MMFCVHCGTKAVADAAFCGGCGRGLAQGGGEPLAAPERRSWPDAGGTGAPPAARRWSESSSRRFQWAGDWYTRDSGVTFRWNPAAERWEPELSSRLPFFMRRPPFASLRTPARWLYSLLGAFMVATLLAMAADGNLMGVANRDSTGYVAYSDVEAAEVLYGAAKFLQILLLLAIPGFFIWWTRRATCNVPALGAARPDFSPGWAVGWWFVPIAAWFQPFRVIRQAWRAGDDALGTEESEDWRQAGVSGWAAVWWVGHILVTPFWSGAAGMPDSAVMEAEELGDVAAVVLVLDALMVVVTALTLWVVAALTSRQEEANRRLDAAASG